MHTFVYIDLSLLGTVRSESRKCFCLKIHLSIIPVSNQRLILNKEFLVTVFYVEKEELITSC